VKLPPSSEVYWFRAFLVCPSEEGTMRVCVILINIWSRGEKKPAYTSNTCQMTLICVFLHCSQSICDSRRKEDECYGLSLDVLFQLSMKVED